MRLSNDPATILIIRRRPFTSPVFLISYSITIISCLMIASNSLIIIACQVFCVVTSVWSCHKNTPIRMGIKPWAKWWIIHVFFSRKRKEGERSDSTKKHKLSHLSEDSSDMPGYISSTDDQLLSPVSMRWNVSSPDDQPQSPVNIWDEMSPHPTMNHSHFVRTVKNLSSTRFFLFYFVFNLRIMYDKNNIYSWIIPDQNIRLLTSS